MNWPIKKKTEKKTDTPTSFPVRFYFFFFNMIVGVLMTLSLALQPLVILPVQAADAQVLRGQGPGQDTCSAFARGSLGVCLPPGALRA